MLEGTLFQGLFMHKGTGKETIDVDVDVAAEWAVFLMKNVRDSGLMRLRLKLDSLAVREEQPQQKQKVEYLQTDECLAENE